MDDPAGQEVLLISTQYTTAGLTLTVSPLVKLSADSV